MIPTLSVVACGPAAMPSSKMGVVQAHTMAHIEGQHCGSGDGELEDAEDPCAYLTRVYQLDPLVLYQKLKDVRPPRALGSIVEVALKGPSQRVALPARARSSK
jgi:hypothetical protein